MSDQTPFFDRIAPLCTSMRWTEWAGYHAVSSFDTCHEVEYHAIRQGAGVLDVTPLFKYEVTGPDSGRFLSFVMTRNIAKLKVGRVVYTCWCDEVGKLVDDGTVTRLSECHYRVTSADPSFSWLVQLTRGFDVQIEESTSELGALAIQGPRSRDIVADILDEDVTKLRYFGAMAARCSGVDVHVTRTGYTGDLGYELWIPRAHALAVWDVLMAAGTPHGLLPVGLNALDMVRIEAGYVLNGVEYNSARHCVIPEQKTTPYEMNLGWTVQLKRDYFVGQEALRREKTQGPARQLVGLVLDWGELESLYAAWDLPPAIPSAAWRSSVPVYAKDSNRQIGYATSGTWSPILKQNLAMALLDAPHIKLGTQVRMEVTVEHERKTVTATVTKRPWYDPPHRSA
jgi:aminomethyltransferase